MRHARIAIGLLLLSLAAPGARAQQAAAPEPVLKISIDPPRVVVGQKALLRIGVLAPNYMTSPPQLPGFQVRNAVTRQLQSVNLSEQRDGISYAGVQFEYAIYPQEAGSYALADQKITVRYAAEPPASREAVLPLPRIAFEAFIPDAASSLRPFVAATKLSIEQTIQRSSDQLKTGDAVTRIVTTKAEGIPAMLLPPQKLVAIDGLALYPAQPSLQDKTDGRTDALTSTRTDSATYMLQRPGDYLLPAIDVGWWNVDAGKMELAHLDAVPLQVAANPAVQGAPSAGATAARWNWDAVIDFIADHWLIVILALAALAGMAWFAPAAAKTIAARYRRRREAYLQSEAWSFRRFRRTAGAGDARRTYFAMLDWLQRFEPAAPDRTISALKTAAADPTLDSEIGSMEQELFAPQHSAGNWSSRRLLRRVSAARRSLQRRAAGNGTGQSLPQQLNPAGGSVPSGRSRRLPAR
jgi:hypothetical protein